jgi:hypothetical protein
MLGMLGAVEISDSVAAVVVGSGVSPASPVSGSISHAVSRNAAISITMIALLERMMQSIIRKLRTVN